MLRRTELGLTQTALAKKLGVTFQQIQKYETAKNRLSAGLLYEVSKALDVPIAYFFETIQGERPRVEGHKVAPSRST